MPSRGRLPVQGAREKPAEPFPVAVDGGGTLMKELAGGGVAGGVLGAVPGWGGPLPRRGGVELLAEL